jgi:hypothetical protein
MILAKSLVNCVLDGWNILLKQELGSRSIVSRVSGNNVLSIVIELEIVNRRALNKDEAQDTQITSGRCQHQGQIALLVYNGPGSSASECWFPKRNYRMSHESRREGFGARVAAGHLPTSRVQQFYAAC